MNADTTIDPARLDGLVLASGGHSTPQAGLCLMEAVAYVRGIAHTDHPACVSTVLGSMGRSLNDTLPVGKRQQLIPLIPDLPGTVDDGHDEARGYMALDWLVRVYLPAWLELSPRCRESAARVRELGRIVDMVSAERAGPVVRAAQSEAAAARAAARDAARDAAGAAAGAAARDAAGAAAWAAARAAARDAAGDAARDAARTPRGRRGGRREGRRGGRRVGRRGGRRGGRREDAAGAAAWAAAGAAAWAAAGAAAWAAARDALQPTVETLQDSVIDLYARMVRVGKGVA